MGLVTRDRIADSLPPFEERNKEPMIFAKYLPVLVI